MIYENNKKFLQKIFLFLIKRLLPYHYLLHHHPQMIISLIMSSARKTQTVTIQFIH